MGRSLEKRYKKRKKKLDMRLSDVTNTAFSVVWKSLYFVRICRTRFQCNLFIYLPIRSCTRFLFRQFNLHLGKYRSTSSIHMMTSPQVSSITHPGLPTYKIWTQSDLYFRRYRVSNIAHLMWRHMTCDDVMMTSPQVSSITHPGLPTYNIWTQSDLYFRRYRVSNIAPLMWRHMTCDDVMMTSPQVSSITNPGLQTYTIWTQSDLYFRR